MLRVEFSQQRGQLVASKFSVDRLAQNALSEAAWPASTSFLGGL